MGKELEVTDCDGLFMFLDFGFLWNCKNGSSKYFRYSCRRAICFVWWLEDILRLPVLKVNNWNHAYKMAFCLILGKCLSNNVVSIEPLTCYWFFLVHSGHWHLFVCLMRSNGFQALLIIVIPRCAAFGHSLAALAGSAACFVTECVMTELTESWLRVHWFSTCHSHLLYVCTVWHQKMLITCNMYCLCSRVWFL